MTLSFPFGKSINFIRYPLSKQKALQAWNAADELIWEQYKDLLISTKVLIVHDKFGVLASLFYEWQPQLLILYASQKKAITMQLQGQGIAQLPMCLPLFDINDESFDVVFLKMPKSVDLFEWYLHRIVQQLSPKGQVVIGFMTKYFSPKYLSISTQYFNEVQQTKAKKKARLLLLSHPKAIHNRQPLLRRWWHGDKHFEQYYGVFSAHKIDAASLFLLDYLNTQSLEYKTLLDVGTGNGILAWYMAMAKPAADIYMTDDSALALASAQRNLGNHPHYHYIYDDTLESIESACIDVALSNPPFHFEFENNIEVALSLFKQLHRVLKSQAVFYCVANRHLNYAVHLRAYFSEVHKVAANDKYEIIKSIK